jgi:nitrile hydratase accessory protein
MNAARPHLEALPGLPRDAEGPVFAAPWQAQAFALALALHARGVYTWPEWAAALAQAIRAAGQAGDPGDGSTYYLHWLQALETLVASKGLAGGGEIARCQRAWQHAAARTPHGQPIALGEQDFGH